LFSSFDTIPTDRQPDTGAIHIIYDARRVR